MKPRQTTFILSLLLIAFCIDATPPGTRLAAAEPNPDTGTLLVQAAEGKYQIEVNYSAAPDLKDWIQEELVPVLEEWYPRIVQLLPSDGFEAPPRVQIVFRERMNVPASASGHRISCNAEWFRENLQGEARGAVVHELVHVAQQYRRAGRARVPGWLVEGIADYIRWFLYEPEAKGAEITERNFARARYDGNYRITANFIHWVTENHGTDIVQKLNAAAREGRYSEELWQEYTGVTLQELGAAWRTTHEERLARTRSPAVTETGTDRDSQKERRNGVENREKKARPVSHFWFNYDHPPHPGRRIWVNVDETTWIEIYPNGHESRYKFKERIALDEFTGVVLEKTSGDLAVTGTLNDGSFQVFIPDRNNPQLILAIRHRHEGEWSQWRGLALITPLE